MTIRKLTGMLLTAAASLCFLAMAVYGPPRAERMEQADDIVVSPTDSFCAGDLRVTLSNKGDYPIYYTLDGSIPTLESARYEDGIFYQCSDQVQSCVIRARAFVGESGTWGDLFTRTYFFAKDMETLKARFSTYIVCVTSDPYNLYDYEYGILTEGKIRDEYVSSEAYDPKILTQPANFTQKGRSWERDAHIEILLADGTQVIDQDTGMRVFGHASRQSYRKSFKLYAREEYGKSSFDYPLFKDNYSAAEGQIQQSYERLVVRNHGTDRSVTLFREELLQLLCSQIEGIDSKCFAPAAVYLNGEYYNFEWLQEVYDERYMEANYGTAGEGYYEIVTLKAEDEEEEELSREEKLAQDDYQILKEYGNKDLTDDIMFNELCQLVDVDNMLRYFAIETYIANWDWPQNNIKIYRYYSPENNYQEGRRDGKWRYLYYDMEAGFNLYNDPDEDWKSIREVLDGNALFQAVMQRKDMQEKFAYYLEQCIEEYFTPKKVHAAVEELRRQRDKELEESIAYKKSMDETYTMTMDSVNSNIDVIYDFVEKRPQMIREEMWELFGIRLP